MQFVIKNYRNITDKNPVCFEIKEGITFILGPNNFGKTNLLKFFYDLRSIIKPLNIGQHQGTYDAKVESYFDLMVNRTAPDNSIEFEIRNDKECVANFVIYPNPAATQRHTQDLKIEYNFRGGNQIPADVSEFVLEVREIALNSFFLGLSRTLSPQTIGYSMDLQTGNQFIKNYSQWADGDDMAMMAEMRLLKNELKSIFGFDQFEIRLNDQKNDLIITVDEVQFFLSELGTGIAEFIVVLVNAMVRKPSYIFIDEPETSLHPKMQEAFVRAVASKARKGLIATSHSVGLARSTADALYSVTKDATRNMIIRPYGEHFAPTLMQTIQEMGYSQFVEIGGNNILLVEGKTDIKSFREILRKYRIETHFIILSFGGSQLMSTDITRIIEELREITRLNAKSVNVIFDSERERADAILQDKFLVFVQACEKLGFNVFPTDRHSTENYITQDAIDKVIGTQFQALSAFENFKETKNKWQKEKNWRMFIQMNKEDFTSTGLGNFIQNILVPLAGN